GGGAASTGEGDGRSGRRPCCRGARGDLARDRAPPPRSHPRGHRAHGGGVGDRQRGGPPRAPAPGAQRGAVDPDGLRPGLRAWAADPPGGHGALAPVGAARPRGVDVVERRQLCVRPGTDRGARARRRDVPRDRPITEQSLRALGRIAVPGGGRVAPWRPGRRRRPRRGDARLPGPDRGDAGGPAAVPPGGPARPSAGGRRGGAAVVPRGPRTVGWGPDGRHGRRTAERDRSGARPTGTRRRGHPAAGGAPPGGGRPPERRGVALVGGGRRPARSGRAPGRHRTVLGAHTPHRRGPLPPRSRGARGRPRRQPGSRPRAVRWLWRRGLPPSASAGCRHAGRLKVHDPRVERVNADRCPGEELRRMETGCVQLVVAVDTEATASEISGRLVDERLAACVQVGGPITSTYRWQGAVETAREFLLVAKTTAERLDALIERVRALHPYDVPEITAVPITGGLPSYLDWIRTETSPA